MAQRQLYLRGAAVSFLVVSGCNVPPSVDNGTASSSQPLTTEGVTETLSITSDWGVGYCASVTLVNGSAAAVTTWSSVLNTNGSPVSQLWSGSYATSGNNVTVTPESYNAAIAANGGTATFGFCASGSGRPTLTSLTITGGGGSSSKSGSSSVHSSSSSSGGSSSSSSRNASSSGSSSLGHSSSSSPGGTTSGEGPCDIFATANTPCVAAHSTVRALYGTYDGHLYQVTRASDNTTEDIGVLTPGGFADAATQDVFCATTTCTITIIYDQSPKANHLTPGPAGQHGTGADKPASATDLKTSASGHEVYGVRIRPGMGYRNDKTTGIATGDEAETEYMVSSQSDLVNKCCFDYGNAETNNHADGDGTMEAVYFGMGANYGTGSGTGPWVEADMENGIYAGIGPAGGTKGIATNTSLAYDYVTAVVVGRSGAAPGSFALYGGNATTGTLTTMWDGARPNGYAPMKKQGAIILGIGGDNSNGAGGDFYEGVMTTGAATVATVDAVQANIVAARYGK